MSQQAPRRARVPIHRASPGFTVVELCVTLAVASVVLAVGIPSLKSFSATNRMATEVNQLLTHLRLARSEAVKRTERIALCPSDDGASCLDAPEWHRGWILFVDPNGNREHDIDEEIVQVRPPARGRIAITSSPFRKRLFFQPNGMSLGSNATITLCSDEARVTPRAVILANTGRSRVSYTQSDGSALDCG